MVLILNPHHFYHNIYLLAQQFLGFIYQFDPWTREWWNNNLSIPPLRDYYADK